MQPSRRTPLICCLEAKLVLCPTQLNNTNNEMYNRTNFVPSNVVPRTFFVVNSLSSSFKWMGEFGLSDMPYLILFAWHIYCRMQAALNSTINYCPCRSFCMFKTFMPQVPLRSKIDIQLCSVVVLAELKWLINRFVTCFRSGPLLQQPLQKPQTMH